MNGRKKKQEVGTSGPEPGLVAVQLQLPCKATVAKWYKSATEGKCQVRLEIDEADKVLLEGHSTLYISSLLEDTDLHPEPGEET